MTATSAFGLRAGNYIPAIWKIRHASRGDKSKRAYDGYLKLIEVTFGSTPIGALEDKRARGDFKEFRDSFSDTPRKAYCELAESAIKKLSEVYEQEQN
jgi:hypothetical protein